MNMYMYMKMFFLLIFFLCLQVFFVNIYRDNFVLYWQVDDYDNISFILEIIFGEMKVYVIFDCYYGDLYLYVRQKKKL